MKEEPLVSVIMPAYNAALYIAEAIQSVLLQHYTNWELWIINDASTDDTLLKVEPFLKDSRIHLLKNHCNSGTAVARNLGIEKAKGSFISFLDADDSWFPEKLKEQLKFMKKNKQEMCYSSYRLMDEDGNMLPEIIEVLPELSYKKLLKSNYVGNLTGIYNAEVLGKIYAPKLRKRQDWGLWLKVLEKTSTVKGILQPLATYRIGNNSISKNKTGLLKYNYLIYKKVLHYSTLKSSICLLMFLKEHFFVKNKQRKEIK